MIWTTLSLLPLLLLGPASASGADEELTNSLGMRMRPVPAGEFVMGRAVGGDYDERPVHRVTISRPFLMSAELVTNAQFEQYDPAHRRRDGGRDEDPVVDVTWHGATAFTLWLAAREGRPYRLPTEAEWEYAARAGGDRVEPWTGAPPWGLERMSGPVEQWCLDWYGPYPDEAVTDPAGYRSGTHRVTRGGSHLVGNDTMRPTNRMGFLPDDRYAALGFRVVIAQDPSHWVDRQPVPRHRRDVSSEGHDWTAHPVDPDEPYFRGPEVFVKIPPGSEGPLFSQHNHFPAITWCPNGDLLVTWYTCLTEGETQLNIASSRLRRGAEAWEEASLFWDSADRNDHSAALWTDPDTGRLFHFQGVGSHPNQGHQVLAMRTSDDSGASWTPPRVINHDRSMWNPHVVMRSREGHLIVTSDYNFDQPMWGRIIVSRDGGESWREPPGKIHGQHCGIVQLDDGRLMAVGRDNWNAEHVATPGLGLPISTSDDGGGNTGRFISDATFAEPRGYLQATQTPDGVIHLVSSRLHYQFNLAWLKTPTPAAE